MVGSIKRGIVQKISEDNVSGILIDERGREYFFFTSEVKDGVYLNPGELVTFIRDADFKSTNIAIFIHPVAS